MRQGLVVRGGFGMSFFPTDITSNPSLKNQPFNVAYGPVGWTASTLFATGGQVLPTTVGSTTIPNSAILGAVRGVPTNFRPGEVLQYNLSTQKDFHGNVVTVAYVGVLERHMPQSYNDINAPAPGLYLKPPPVSQTRNSQKARPNYATAPNMTTISWYASSGVGMYNSAQVSAERRLANGLSFSVNYAYARNQDNFLGISNQSGSTAAYGYYKAGTAAGDRYERANSDLDLRNRMAATINYTLPFFKSASGFKAQALKGWQINTLASWAAGQPQTVANSTNQNGTGTWRCKQRSPEPHWYPHAEGIRPQPIAILQ